MIEAGSQARPVPYPANTRAKGWRFELEIERIEQSDTWPLAAEFPLAQHCLLMMWVVAWSQDPCGSFPNDEEVIRAKCRIPPSTWGKCRAVLMRRWWLAEDGRLYHDTLTKRVLEMMARRRSDSDRQAAKRARDSADSHSSTPGITPVSRVTPARVTPESSTDNRVPNTEEEKKEKGARKRLPTPSAPSRPDDVDAQVWSDWLVLRKSKNAPVTPTVLDAARTEAGKAGMPLQAFLTLWCSRGSQGLEASWLKLPERGKAGASKHSGFESMNYREGVEADGSFS